MYCVPCADPSYFPCTLETHQNPTQHYVEMNNFVHLSNCTAAQLRLATWRMILNNFLSFRYCKKFLFDITRIYYEFTQNSTLTKQNCSTMSAFVLPSVFSQSFHVAIFLNRTSNNHSTTAITIQTKWDSIPFLGSPRKNNKRST